MGQIYLVRSAQASFGGAHYDQLSDRGHAQARLLGQWLSQQQRPIHRVLTGGMVRHTQTARACLAGLPVDLLPTKLQPAGPHVDERFDTDAGFAEFDHHEVMQRHSPGFADPEAFVAALAGEADPQRALENIFRAAMQRWMTGWHDDEYTESWPDFRSRVLAALERLDQPDSKQTTLVFTSSGVIATLMQHVLGLQDYQVMELTWKFANCSVTRLLHRPGEFGLSYLNNYAHLEWLGGAEMVSYR